MEESAVSAVLKQAGVERDYLELFLENGIDSREVLIEITEQHLKELGITNLKHVARIIQARNNLFSLPQETQPGSSEPLRTATSEEVPITISMLLRASPSQKYTHTEQPEDFIKKLTHISLPEKGITRIANLDLCYKVQVLYLYDNLIQKMENLDNLRNLRVLYLQNNQITTIEGLSNCINLRRIVLDGNVITVLQGIENCSHLEELICNNQKISTPFTIDEYSIAGISSSLKKLSLSGNKLQNIEGLHYLDSLKECDLSDNAIDMGEGLIRMLNCMRGLQSLILKTNPVARRPKYRDEVIMNCLSISQLDGKNILDNEREYLFRLKSQKKIGTRKASTSSLQSDGLSIVGTKKL